MYSIAKKFVVYTTALIIISIGSCTIAWKYDDYQREQRLAALRLEYDVCAQAWENDYLVKHGISDKSKLKLGDSFAIGFVVGLNCGDRV